MTPHLDLSTKGLRPSDVRGCDQPELVSTSLEGSPLGSPEPANRAMAPALEAISGSDEGLSHVKSGDVGAQSESKAPRPNRVDRRIALLKRCGLFAEKTPGVEISRACSAEDLLAAYTLVHEVFVERGYCKPKEYGMRLRVFEATPEMATFVAKSDGRIVGVLSVVGHTDECGLPSDRAFRDELDALRASRPNGKFCEWSNQVVAQDFRKSNVTTELMRCAAAHVIKTGYSHSIISVSSVHSAFYELLGFKQIGPKRSYSQDIDDPVIPLCLPSSLYVTPNGQEDELASFVRRFMATENPHLPSIVGWNVEARQMFCDSSSLRKIFGQKSNFARSCELDGQTALIRQWGPRVFRRVVGNTVRGGLLAWISTAFEVASNTAKSIAGVLSTRKQQFRWSAALKLHGSRP